MRSRRRAHSTAAACDGRLKTWLPLLLACLFALALQLIILLRSPIVADDGVTFVSFAWKLDQFAEAVRTHSQHPGYPALIWISAKVASQCSQAFSHEDWVLTARVIAMLAGVLTVPVIWSLTRRQYGTRAAHVSAFLFAAWPLFRRNAADALSDTPHLLVYLCAAWCVCVGFENRKARWFLAAGLFSGLAFWIRPEGLSVALVGCVFLLVGSAWRNENHVRRCAHCAPLLLSAALLVAAPYVVTANRISGKVTDKFKTAPTTEINTGDAAVSGDRASEAESGSSATGRLRESRPVRSNSTIRQAEVDVSAQAVKNEPAHSRNNGPLVRLAAAPRWVEAALTLAGRYIQWGHLLLIPAAVMLSRPSQWRKFDSRTWFLACLFGFHCVLLVCLHVLAGYISSRHVMPMLALTAPLASHGVCTICGAAAEALSKRGMAAVGTAHTASICLTVSVAILIVMPHCTERIHSQHLGTYEAIRWIKSHVASQSVVITNSRFARIYLDQECQYVSPPSRLTARPDSNAPAEDRVILLVQSHTDSYDPRWWDEAQAMGKRLFSAINRTRKQTLSVAIWSIPTVEQIAETSTHEHL